jgi:uncharacterized coiled-coil protein SlyX
MKRIALSVLILVLMAYSCENPLEDRVEELEYQLALYEQQQSVIDSLFNVLFNQQALIDSLMAEQKVHLDSVSSELLARIDSLNTMQQEIVDMLINAQDVTGTGEDYVRVSNVQICWGEGETNMNGSTENFPVSFVEPPIIIMNPIADGQIIPSIEDITTSTATFYLNTMNLTSFNYQAIGYWL